MVKLEGRVPIRKHSLTEATIPECSKKWCVNGVSIIHIKVVPAAFSSKVVELQSEYRVGPEKHKQRGEF